MPRTRTLLVAAAGLSPLIAQTDWTARTPASSPPPFTAHAMAYHLPSDRTVLFGGVAGGVRASDTWTWDGATWTQATPTNVPPARVAHTLVYDPLRARLVMFGGIPTGGGYLGDTWEWDGLDWIAAAPTTSPTARRSHAMAFLPSRGTTILWGGYAGTDLADTWEWNGIDWAAIPTPQSPPARRATDMAHDPVGGGLVLFSGYLMGNDTWRFDGATWTQLQPTASPSARFDHSMVTDEARERIVMFGGPGVADQWEWDGTTWLQRTPATLPAARSDTYLAYDSARETVWMFGSVATSETWSYDPVFRASFTTSGAGCAGSLAQAPALSSTDRPWLGEVFVVDVAPVPSNALAFMVYGFSDTTAPGFGSLPASLAPFGMPGCTLQVDPVATDVFVAAGNTATWQRPIVNATALLGATIHCQAACFDPPANAIGVVVGNHGTMGIGGR